MPKCYEISNTFIILLVAPGNSTLIKMRKLLRWN